MKKIILLSVFFLCGCTNTLTCTYKTNFGDIEIVNKIVFDFDKETYEQIDKMIFSDSISASSYFKEIEDYKEEYNLLLTNNEIISNINDIIKLDGDKQKIKEQYESYNYKCK